MDNSNIRVHHGKPPRHTKTGGFDSSSEGAEGESEVSDTLVLRKEMVVSPKVQNGEKLVIDNSVNNAKTLVLDQTDSTGVTQAMPESQAPAESEKDICETESKPKKKKKKSIYNK